MQKKNAKLKLLQISANSAAQRLYSGSGAQLVNSAYPSVSLPGSEVLKSEVGKPAPASYYTSPALGQMIVGGGNSSIGPFGSAETTAKPPGSAPVVGVPGNSASTSLGQQQAEGTAPAQSLFGATNISSSTNAERQAVNEEANEVYREKRDAERQKLEELTKKKEVLLEQLRASSELAELEARLVQERDAVADRNVLLLDFLLTVKLIVTRGWGRK